MQILVVLGKKKKNGKEKKAFLHFLQKYEVSLKIFKTKLSFFNSWNSYGQISTKTMGIINIYLRIT